MPFTPNFLERLLVLKLNQAPAPALDLWGGPGFWFVLTAIRLHIFETLQAKPVGGPELAHKLALNERGTTILLAALAELGYVRERGEQYQLTAMTRKWLLPDGTINFSPYFQFCGALMEHFLPHLSVSIKTGQAPLHLYDWLETQPEISRYFQEGMIAITRYALNDVVKALSLPLTAARLLDIGGGHALYSIALCRKYPHLTAVVFDSQQALTVGRESIATAGLNGRISTQAGNFLTADPPTGFDVALLFNLVHGFQAEQNIALLGQVARSLNPGGRVIILEQLADASPLPMPRAIGHILSLTFYHTLNGQMYTFETMRGWLETAGFSAVERKTLPKISSGLISARLTK